VADIPRWFRGRIVRGRLRDGRWLGLARGGSNRSGVRSGFDELRGHGWRGGGYDLCRSNSGGDNHFGGWQRPANVLAADLVGADHVANLDPDRLLAGLGVHRDFEREAPGDLLFVELEELQ